MDDDQKDVNRKQVLFLTTADEPIHADNALFEKKIRGLVDEFGVYFFARGKGFGVDKYGAHFYLFPRFLGKLNVFFWMLTALIYVPWMIRKHKIDTIIVQSPVFEGVVGALIAKMTGRELIVEMHGDWLGSPFYYFKIPFPGLVRRMLKAVGSFTLKRADKIRVISSFTHGLADQFAKDTPRYEFATFTDINMFYKEDVGEGVWKPRIVYVGWLYYLKGVHLLIEAFQSMRESYPEYELVIVGSGPYEDELKKVAGDTPQITFTGSKQLDEVKDIMKECTCVVLPSYSEGLGRVLIEALALKKPVIGAKVDGIPDLAIDGKTGYVFERGNAEDLALKIDLLLSDIDKAKEMGEYGHTYVKQRFSTEKFFEGYKEMVYDNPRRT